MNDLTEVCIVAITVVALVIVAVRVIGHKYGYRLDDVPPNESDGN